MNRIDVFSRVACLCVLALVLSAYHSALQAADSPVVHRWDFLSPDSTEGWQAGEGLKDLAVVDSKLRMTLTAVDAYLFAPPVEVPLDGCVIRIRLRGPCTGPTQVYWRTELDPTFSERQTMTLETLGAGANFDPGGSDGFVTLEFPIGAPADTARLLTGFRIDPYNAGTPAGVARLVEIDFVEVQRRPPAIEVDFTASSHRIDPGRPIPLRVSVRQVAGRAIDAAFDITVIGAKRLHLRVPPGKAASAAMDDAAAGSGVHVSRATVRSSIGTGQWDLQTSVIVGADDTLPVIPGLRSERLRLDFIRTTDGESLGAARLQIADERDGWKTAGWLLPLTQLLFQSAQGAIIRREPALKLLEHTDRLARLGATVEDAPDWHVELELELIGREGSQAVAVTALLTGPEGGLLHEFSGPVLRADDQDTGDLQDRFALFGGLEFLGPGWRSSSERAVGRRFADRWSPHPFKITLPVMAVESAGVTTALMWHPLQIWDGVQSMPTATFGSPNFLDDQPNHLMKLSIPTIPRWRHENRLPAQQPYLIRCVQPLMLRYTLLAERHLPVALTARRWYERFGAPAAPAPPHDDKYTYELIARCFGDTVYWPGEKGWRPHWYLDKVSRFDRDMAAELIAHAEETHNRQWIERTALSKRSIIDTVGPLSARLRNDRRARTQLETMRPDGTWAFVNTETMRRRTREATHHEHNGLGLDGSTSLGTCVRAALPILQYALLTGDEKYMAASVKALESMSRFRVPRGAQTWEVHQDIPDIRAAALAVSAYHMGYRLTGDSRWLDEASYWAWAGVAFLYSWHVPIEENPGTVLASLDRRGENRCARPLSRAFQNPDRQVTPYGSVPVFGPTFYVCNWFGVIVQWCGLEWAQHVIELDADRRDPLLRTIADGVAASGLQQMFDRPPWIGLYPDVWETRHNRALGAFINPRLLMRCLQAQGRLPAWTVPWTRILRDDPGKQRWHVSGWGKPIALDAPVRTGSWSAQVDFLPGQPNELMVVGAAPPARVSVAGRELELHHGPTLTGHHSGWWYDPDHRAVLVRFVQPDLRALEGRSPSRADLLTVSLHELGD